MMARGLRPHQALAYGMHALVVLTGAIQAWSQRLAMNPDGISYLDLAGRYAGGDWTAALNGYWSPLYPALLGLVFRAVHPSPAGEFALAHALNFGLYLATYAAMLWLAAELSRVPGPGHAQGAPPAVSRSGWTHVALTAVFLWATLGLVPLGLVVPDLAALMLELVTAALLLRMARGWASRAGCAGFGALLGVAYLARASHLVLAPVWLMALYFATRTRPGAGQRLAAATAGCVLIVAALAGPLSLASGRFTVGDTGRLNYARFVTGPRSLGPMSGAPGLRLDHPVRRLLADPPVYEFAQPVVGTYPVWTAPAYWQQGRAARFDAGAQWEVFRRSLDRYRTILAPLLAAALVLGLAGGGRESWQRLRQSAIVIVPCFAGLVVYALVHVEHRFIAPFALPLALAIGYSLRATASVTATRLVGGLALAGVGLTLQCGIANFGCGTGTTTAMMLAFAGVVMGGALCARAWQTGTWGIRSFGAATAAIAIPILGRDDTVIAGLFLTLLAGLLVSAKERTDERLAGVWIERGVSGWALGLLVVPILLQTASAGRAILRGAPPEGSDAVVTAQALQRQGLHEADHVASIGNAFEAYWARLARVRIVAEIPRSDMAVLRFWNADSTAQARALSALGSSGARAVVADWPADSSTPRGWTRVDATHLLRWLDAPAPRAD